MLPKAHRLRRSADLQRLWQRGQAFRHPLATLMIRANDLDMSRFAFAAGRRVGGAVKRNRAKRLMREAVRRHLTEIESGWDCLLVARREIVSASHHDVEDAVGILMGSSGLLRGRNDRFETTSPWSSLSPKGEVE